MTGVFGPHSGPYEMARPRTFDRDAALDAAVRVFWERGYRGASLDDLTAACGGSKPSLYAAFGDKAGLFAAALARYAERYDDADLAALDAEPDGRAAVRAYLNAAAERFTDPALPPGCLIAAHCATLGGPDEEVTRPAADADAAAHARLRGRLARAKADGQLPPGEPLGPLADHFHGVRHGLSAAARLGRSRRALLASVDVAMRAWPGS